MDEHYNKLLDRFEEAARLLDTVVTEFSSNALSNDQADLLEKIDSFLDNIMDSEDILKGRSL
jgi:hypothetical protein